MNTLLSLPVDLTQRLESLAQKTEKSPLFCLREALETYIEDQEDYLKAVAVKKRILSGQEKTYSLEEVEKMCGLDDE
jgi:RHH-type rel operon transcriptional repressor/antitoxin RelB